MPRTALHFYDNTSRVKGATIITADALMQELILKRFLGKGGWGAAFSAEFRGENVVVKLPIRLLKHRLPTPTKNGWTLTDVLRPKSEQLRHEFIEAHHVMEIECHNAERALEPPELRQARKREHAGLLAVERPFPEHLRGAHSPPPEEWKEISDRTLGRGLPPLSQKTDAVYRALDKWRRHEGYWHMHPIIHYDRDIPLLMSEPATNTIDALRLEVNGSTRLRTHWLDVAWQLSEAIRFLHDLPQLAHVDIKPPNVFFTLPSQTHCHIWLGDYGDLYPMGVVTDFKQGTALYKPNLVQSINRFKGVQATFFQQSLYMYFATLMDLFVPDGKLHSMPYGWFVFEDRNIGQCVDDGELPLAIEAFLNKQPSTQMLWTSLSYHQFGNLEHNFQEFRKFVRQELAHRR